MGGGDPAAGAAGATRCDQWHGRRIALPCRMKHSVVWATFFFAGLLFACARLADDGRTSSASLRLARRTEIVHKLKVRIGFVDVWSASSERAFARPRTPVSRGPL